LQGVEIHTAWLMRKYLSQAKIKDFADLDKSKRIREVKKYRNSELLRLQKRAKTKQYHNVKKFYRKSEEYIHLTHSQRVQFVLDLAALVSKWGFARLFAECIDKIHFDPARTSSSIDEQAFEQVVSRYEQYLSAIDVLKGTDRNYALLIHDNNPTASAQLTDLMKRFHDKGTFWTRIENIIETPLFVDSRLTGLVQIADLAAYALRRYVENDEEELFNLIFERADKRDGRIVGVRHFSDEDCECKICKAHTSKKASS